MKRLTNYILLTLCLAFLPLQFLHVSALPAEKQFIYDEADLLTTEEEESLQAMAIALGTERETDFVIVTSKDADGKDVERYMGDFYDEHAFGYDKPHGNTAMFVIDMSVRDFYLSGFGVAEEKLSSERLDLINEAVTPHLSDGEYYEAFEIFLETSDQYMGIPTWVNPDWFIFKPKINLYVAIGLGVFITLLLVVNTGGRVTVNGRTYLDNNHSRVLDSKDKYTHTTVSRRAKPKSNSNGGGGGGTTSGGSSYSGSRGSF